MKKRIFAVSLLSTLMLAACGGGGGGSAGSSNPGAPVGSNPAPTPAPTPEPVAQTALQTSVPAPSYQAGSTTLSAFMTLNAARQAYGIGLRAQHEKIDVAAQNHAKYMLYHWGVGDFANAAHQEDKIKPGFTGEGVTQRMAFAGYYAGPAGEALSIAIEVDGVKSDPGVFAIDGLLAAPYHRFGLLDSTRDVGLADASGRFPGEGGVNHMFVVNYGTRDGVPAQLPATNWFGMWPVPDAVEVNFAFSGETPDPIPVNKGACAGYPVSFQVHTSLALTVSAFTLVESLSGAPISVQLSTPQIDANPIQARHNTAYIIPYRPLKLGTKYIARFVGTSGPTAIDKTWSFTTEAKNTRMMRGCTPG